MSVSELQQEILKLRNAIREHRDLKGDDRCWEADVLLYQQALPEGLADSDLRIESPEARIERCKQYNASHQPDGCPYVSPQREIERLKQENQTLREKISPSPDLHNLHLKSVKPDIGWKWGKWTFGFWRDVANCTAFGLDVGPLEIVWRYDGYRP